MSRGQCMTAMACREAAVACGIGHSMGNGLPSRGQYRPKGSGRWMLSIVVGARHSGCCCFVLVLAANGGSCRQYQQLGIPLAIAVVTLLITYLTERSVAVHTRLTNAPVEEHWEADRR